MCTYVHRKKIMVLSPITESRNTYRGYTYASIHQQTRVRIIVQVFLLPT